MIPLIKQSKFCHNLYCAETWSVWGWWIFHILLVREGEPWQFLTLHRGSVRGCGQSSCLSLLLRPNPNREEWKCGWSKTCQSENIALFLRISIKTWVSEAHLRVSLLNIGEPQTWWIMVFTATVTHGCQQRPMPWHWIGFCWWHLLVDEGTSKGFD